MARNLGMVFLSIEARGRVTKQQSYILDGSDALFLSWEALMDLGVIPK
jgi:hypothetical protein